jgi:iron(III) transport system ATP-binding protein
MSAIELRGVAKRFGATPVLTDVNLSVAVGSITAVLGASGSGKTTLLRLIAGFEHLDAGTLTIGGHVVDDAHRTVSVQHRCVGYVPQEGALFPHLTVAGNIAFGVPRRARDDIEPLLELTGLGELRTRYPHQLSGGEQQRVALARALAIRPSVVLLDEPFSALDASLRIQLRQDVARILAASAATAVLVTHDQDEALALADQIALLQAGRVMACGTPRALYRHPPDAAAAASIGEANLLPATLFAGHARCSLGVVAVAHKGSAPCDGPAELLIRPEQLVLHLDEFGDAPHATVVALQYYGHDALATIRLGDGHADLVARVPGALDLSAGTAVWIEILGPAHVWAQTTAT